MRGCTFILLFFFLTSFFISAKTVTITVQSYSSAAVSSGEGLSDLVISYSQTNNRKSQLTAGNSLTLQISGKWRVKISKIGVRVKSNKTAGAGSLLVTMNRSVLWEIADSKFNSAEWNGAYSNEYITIEKAFDNILWADNLVLTITASVSSLYFESLSIEYTVLPPEPFNVRFITYTDVACTSLTERSAGAGITLPEIESPEGWTFLGWGRQPVFDSYAQPNVLLPNTLFFPDDNITLYAVYEELSYDVVEQDTTYASGEYAMVFYTFDDRFFILKGVPENGKVATDECELFADEDTLYSFSVQNVPSDYRYVLTFTDSTVVIMHKESETYIGKSTSKVALQARNFTWRWERGEHRGIIVYNPHKENVDQWVVFVDIDEANAGKRNLELFTANKSYPSSFILFPLLGVGEYYEPLFTSNPLNRDTSEYQYTGLELINTRPATSFLPQRAYRVFDMLGREMNTDIHSLPKGTWIIKQDNSIFKIMR